MIKSISEIFKNSIYRIPDYQRGYSWKESHLDDFWQDVTNLQLNNSHYTGSITIEEATKIRREKKWIHDKWILQQQNITPYYIVDGQQRITTVIVLIKCLIDFLDDNERYQSQKKEAIIEKYI